MPKIYSPSVGVGGIPQGKVSCHNVSGLMPPKGQKEWFGVKYVVGEHFGK